MAKILGQLEKHSAKTRNSCGSSKPSTLVRLVWAWYVGVHSPNIPTKIIRESATNSNGFSKEKHAPKLNAVFFDSKTKMIM